MKLASSVFLFVALISFTIIVAHSKEIRVNKISMLPYYAVIGQAIFMIVYYTGFGLF